jgi:hypothetical protein
LSSDERRRRAPFLTVLGTHCISRSFPLPPQRMPASPAAASAAPGPAPHAHPAASKRPRNQTPHVHAARCVGVPAAARPSASHAGRGDTLEAPCCRTRRRRRAKHRLREREAVPQRQAVPIVAPSTRARLRPCSWGSCPPPRAPTPASAARRRGRAAPPGQTPAPPPGTAPGPSTRRRLSPVSMISKPEAYVLVRGAH